MTNRRSLDDARPPLLPPAGPVAGPRDSRSPEHDTTEAGAGEQRWPVHVFQGGQANPADNQGCRGNPSANRCRAAQKPGSQRAQQTAHGDGRPHPNRPPGQSGTLTDQTTGEVEEQPPTAAPTALSEGAHCEQSHQVEDQFC